ncbi:uncharacterized protein LOC132720278 isoform X2 [Ruditapes philippinarum]|uniref:uncharacterized protein LOC132720278 isoform X2 n=1 Tax=Ruditapes philippinarum TaxID=129788 RepID=UPI00295B420E|nr:uncharacterized protein LOC132720278 isoform X2 [Ruditapes philippinarum]
MSLNTRRSIQDHQVFTYDLLVTNVCSHANFNRSQSCQQSGFLLSETIKHCGFQSLCEPEYKARCINTLEGGMAHICVPVDLSCEKGVWRKAWIDKENKNIVKVQEEICPERRFQPNKSNCFDACRKVHLDLNNLEDWYIVYSTGDNKSPTYVYCNYKKGFYNLSNKTFLNYDQDSAHEIYFCRNKKEINPGCVENKNPLPNGTCVAACASGECRDDHDHFICKRNCSSNIGISESPGDSIKDVRNKSTEIASEENKEPIQTDWKHILLIAIVFFICAFVFIGILYAVIRYRKRHGRNPSNALEMLSRSRQDLPETESQNNNNESERNKDTFDGTREKETELDHELTKPLLQRQPNTDQDCLEACASPSNSLKTCIQGGELKKEVDDTFTQSVMANLNISLMSCGALINDGNLEGTVFRVGSKYVMTAYHVIKDIKHLIQTARDNIFVNFAESVCVVSCKTYRVIIEFYVKEVDIAILALHDVANLETLPKPLLLWPKNVDLLKIRNISVIGYGHPDSPYKKHLEKCKILTDPLTETRVTAAKDFLQKKKEEFTQDITWIGKDHTSIDRGYGDYNNRNIIKFDCYMAKGLSGGPILTNEHKTTRVIGIVIGMRPELFYNLSHNKQATFPKDFMFEFGVKMHIVYEQLIAVNPALAQDIFPPDTTSSNEQLYP